MISPRTEPTEEPGGSSLKEASEAFFRPGGQFEKACAGEPFPYEPRPQQLAMAGAVAENIEACRHLAVEAGTGVGKSFAYLVPAILAGLQRQTKVVISTYTISLQEQLMYKDIPFLQEHLGVDFKAVLVKGRSNYLCLRRLARARKLAPDLFKRNPEEELEAIRSWADVTAEGSRQDLSEQPSPEVWDLVCAEQGNCMWQQCPEFGRCFFMKARSQIQEADVLVVNHHLFFSDLVLRTGGAGFLPAYDVVVLDEAHQVENVATEHLGLRLSQYAFEHLLRRLYVPDKQKGLLSVLRKGEEAHTVQRLWDAVADFFMAVRNWAGLSPDHPQKVLPAPPDVATAVPELLGRLSAQLRDLVEEVDNPDIQAELRSVQLRCVGLRESLDAFLKQALEDQVYWVELEGRRKQSAVLYSAPVEVANDLARTLFDNLECVIMTSATMAVGGKLEYFRERIGAEDCDELQVGSPFDYARQMRVYTARHMPAPNDTEAFLPAAAKAIQRYVRMTQGHAFVLFTSARIMKKMADILQDFFADEGFPLFVQGAGMPRHVMLERFREEPSSVLFGLDSFWMGVDVRGEALRNVIITRLPFTVPDLPVVKARMDRIRERGGDPFKDYSLPEAVLKFRQGVGRLIRTGSDEGMVVILDSRVSTKWYGKVFLRSIPDCPVEEIEAG